MSATSTLAAPFPRFARSQALIGASSPLWGYFAGAALFGAAFWWASRWGSLAAATIEAAPKTLGAVKPPAPLMLAPTPLPEPVAAPEPAPLAVVEPAPPEPAPASMTPAPMLAEETPALPTGGESAPISPLAAAEAEPAPPPVAALREEPVVHAAPEPAATPAPKRKAKDAEPKPH